MLVGKLVSMIFEVFVNKHCKDSLDLPLITVVMVMFSTLPLFILSMTYDNNQRACAPKEILFPLKIGFSSNFGPRISMQRFYFSTQVVG